MKKLCVNRDWVRSSITGLFHCMIMCVLPGGTGFWIILSPIGILYLRVEYGIMHGVWLIWGKNKLEKVEYEPAKLKNITGSDTLKEVTIWQINTTQELMQITSRVLEGELEAQQANYDRSITLLREAVEIEDQLSYNEPPDWFFPVRHNLGSILLKANRAAEAEQIYRKDLDKFPNNGWSIYGLWQSLKAQNKTGEAADVEKRFEKAWKHADLELTASRIM